MNYLEYAGIFQETLDEAMIPEATSGWMEMNSNLVRYNGGKEIKMPSIIMDGLADYDRNKGFAPGAVTLSWKTYELTKDRGRLFMLDENDVDETNFVVSAGTVMGEFQRSKVVPEVDAYRYSTIYDKSELNGRNREIELTKDNIVAELKADITAVQDEIGDAVQLVISMSYEAATLLDEANDIRKILDVTDFEQGEVTTKVRSFDSIPIRRVSSSRFKTAYTFSPGWTEAETKGGFTADEGAQKINWEITARASIIAIAKTDGVRIFDPQINQKARAWSLDYRKYHDLWIPDNKINGICTSIAPIPVMTVPKLADTAITFNGNAGTVSVGTSVNKGELALKLNKKALVMVQVGTGSYVKMQEKSSYNYKYTIDNLKAGIIKIKIDDSTYTVTVTKA